MEFPAVAGANGRPFQHTIGFLSIGKINKILRRDLLSRLKIFLTFGHNAEVADNHVHFATLVLLVANRITNEFAVCGNRINAISVIENKRLSFIFPLGRNIGRIVFHTPQFHGSIIDCDGTQTGIRRHCNSGSQSFFGQRAKYRISLEANAIVVFNEDFERVALTNLQNPANLFRNDHTSNVINSADNTSSFHFNFPLSLDTLSIAE